MSLFERFRDWLVERDLKRRPIDLPEHAEPRGSSDQGGDERAGYLMGGSPERLTGDVRDPHR